GGLPARAPAEGPPRRGLGPRRPGVRAAWFAFVRQSRPARLRDQDPDAGTRSKSYTRWMLSATLSTDPTFGFSIWKSPKVNPVDAVPCIWPRRMYASTVHDVGLVTSRTVRSPNSVNVTRPVSGKGIVRPCNSFGTSVTVGYLSVSSVRRWRNPSRIDRSLFNPRRPTTNFDSAGMTFPLSSMAKLPVTLSVTPTASLGKLMCANC